MAFSGAITAQETKATKSLSRAYLGSSLSMVEIVNKYGDVNVVEWDNDSVRFDVTIEAYGKSESSARKIMNRIDFDFKHVGQYVSAETILDRKSGFFEEIWNSIDDYSKKLLSSNKLTINYEVSVPKGAGIDVENKFGEVYLADLSGRIDIKMSHGELKTGILNGESKLDLSFVNALIKEVKNGEVKLNASELEIELAHLLELQSNSSEINIEQANRLRIDSRGDRKMEIHEVGILRGKSSFTRIEVDELVEEVDLNMSFGDIRIRNVKSNFSQLIIDGKSADIRVSFDPKAYFNLDLFAKEEKLTMEYIDEKSVETSHPEDKFVLIRGLVGSEKPYPGVVKINAQNGEVRIEIP